MSLERTRVFAIFPTLSSPENYTSCLGATLYTDHQKAQQELTKQHFVRKAQLEQVERDTRSRELQRISSAYRHASPKKLFFALASVPKEKKVESDLDVGIYWTWASGDDVFLPYGVIDLGSKGFTPATVSLTGWELLTEDEITVIRVEQALRGSVRRTEIGVDLDRAEMFKLDWRANKADQPPKRPSDHLSQAMERTRRLRDTRAAFTPQRQHRYPRNRSGKS